jgi:hypothetical protein
MSDAKDLRKMLDDWPYRADDNVRLVTGADGRQVLQVRLPLGIEQYELEGRPDGRRPHNKESALDFHVARLEAARFEAKESRFTLSAEDCAELFDEGTLYYSRYLHLFQVGDWERTVRDTGRNLRLFDFVRAHALREEDRQHLEKWRPYLLRMNGVARAMQALGGDDYAGALNRINEVAGQLTALPEIEDETFRFERERSLLVLRQMADEIRRAKPVSRLEQLEAELHKAVAAEEFERAAGLRDRIRALRERSESKPQPKQN